MHRVANCTLLCLDAKARCENSSCESQGWGSNWGWHLVRFMVRRSSRGSITVRVFSRAQRLSSSSSPSWRPLGVEVKQNSNKIFPNLLKRLLQFPQKVRAAGPPHLWHWGALLHLVCNSSSTESCLEAFFVLLNFTYTCSGHELHG